jgi:hypothetical protein
MLRRGVVSEFDEAAGLGTVTADDGTAYPFQCTQLADGSRGVDVGAEVTFAVRPWHRGRYEAVAITKVIAAPQAPL